MVQISIDMETLKEKIKEEIMENVEFDNVDIDLEVFELDKDYEIKIEVNKVNLTQKF